MKGKMLIAGCLIAGSLFAQSADELHETGKTFMRQGDYTNAEMVLTRAQQQKPTDASITSDLAFNAYLKRDLFKAKQIITPLLDREDADEQIFQLAGNIYLDLSELKECEKIYKRGLKKFPNSGAIYNEYGELLLQLNDRNAINMWESGIEKDPSFPSNYYHAARYYFTTRNRIWTMIYGEIFLNLESFTNRSADMKTLLLESYKQFFNPAEASLNLLAASKGKFARAFYESLMKQSPMAASGINPETLIMIRSRFILDWYRSEAGLYPFRLFDHLRELMRNGLFDAYNQWLFGTVSDPAAYQNWMQTHKDEYNDFNRLQKSRVYKVPAGQYYQGK